MAAEQLQIQVSANVSNAVIGLSDLEKGLKSTESAGAGLGNKGLPQVAKGASQATFALQNFGRVASDAPFGLIGIANNIDPLVQSFVQLRKETGSGKAAFAALTSSLTGGGGLILAVSLVTSALQFAQLGFSRWGASAKKAKEEQDSLKAGTDQFIATVTKQRTEVESLVKVVKDANQTEKARTDALNRLNEILPDTIGKLNQQNIATKEGAEILKGYIQAVEAKATAELLSNRIAENSIKIFDERNKLSEENKRIETEIGVLRQRLGRIDIGATGRAGESAALRALSLQSDINKLVKEQSNLQKESQRNVESLTKSNEQLRGEYEKQLPSVLTLNDNQKKSKKTVNEITDLLSKYREELKGINWDEQNRQIDGTNERVKLAGDTLKSLYLAGVKETSAAWQEVNKNLKEFQAAQDYKQFRDGLERVNAEVKNNLILNTDANKEFVKGYKKSIELIPQVSKETQNLILFRKKYLDNEKEIRLIQEQLASTINNALSPAIDSIFSAFEKGQNPFDALADSVKQFTIELGKALVKQLLFNAVSNLIAPGSSAATGGLAKLFLRGDTLRTATFTR